MRKEQIINELQELQNFIKVELYNSVLYGTRMRMIDKIDNIINLIEFEPLKDFNPADYEK